MNKILDPPCASYARPEHAEIRAHLQQTQSEDDAAEDEEDDDDDNDDDDDVKIQEVQCNRVLTSTVAVCVCLGVLMSLLNNLRVLQLISGSNDGSVMVWNFKPQLRAFRFSGHKAAVLTVAYCPVTGLVASGSKDRTVRMWIPTVYVVCIYIAAAARPRTRF